MSAYFKEFRKSCLNPSKLDLRFDQENSWAIAKFCPELFDPVKYDWENESSAVVLYCPKNFDPDRFNWENGSWAVACEMPDKLDVNKFNWQKYSDYVAEYCPDKLKKNPLLTILHVATSSVSDETLDVFFLASYKGEKETFVIQTTDKQAVNQISRIYDNNKQQQAWVNFAWPQLEKSLSKWIRSVEEM